MRSERVTFKNRRGIELSGILDLPDAGVPAHFAVFAHCFTCSKDFKLAVNMDRELVGKGIAVLRFDFTGLGQSEGDFSDTTFTTNAEDIVSAADYLSDFHEPPGLLVGHSLGGTAALYAAPSIRSSSAVVTIATPSEPRHLKKYLGIDRDALASKGKADITVAGRSFTIGKEFVDDIERVNMAERIRDLGRALLILHSPGDSVVGMDNAAYIFRHARQPKSFISLDGADHLLLNEADARYVGTLIAAWSLRYMGRRG
jgi:putative redox protein